MVAALLLLLSACGAGPKAIIEGTLRDTLFAVEPRANNTISVWMTHDDVGVYCTTDTELGAKALSFLRSTNPDVIITYRSVNNDIPNGHGWAICLAAVAPLNGDRMCRSINY